MPSSSWRKLGSPCRGVVREVRPAVERAALRRQEHRHRPAAAAGQRLHRAHVDLVEVGPLLAVDLDRDEAGVQERRGRLVLERLALHDVAPVARRVADRQEDRAVEELRPSQRLRPPREPVHGVVGVLEQVRARLAREAVRGTLLRHRASLPASLATLERVDDLRERLRHVRWLGGGSGRASRRSPSASAPSTASASTPPTRRSSVTSGDRRRRSTRCSRSFSRWTWTSAGSIDHPR